VVGVAFQNLVGAENIGFIIPTPVVDHFLKDVDSHGQYTGFGSLGITALPLENQQVHFIICGVCVLLSTDLY
jgi:S1-C subfamily serine protease